MCTAQEVDGESFLLLKEDNLKEMLPLHCSWSSNKIQGGNSTQGRPIGVFPGPIHACNMHARLYCNLMLLLLIMYMSVYTVISTVTALIIHNRSLDIQEAGDNLATMAAVNCVPNNSQANRTPVSPTKLNSTRYTFNVLCR